MTADPLAVVVVAAGRGERLAAGSPKALVEVGGQPMVRRAVDACAALDPDHVVVAAPPDHLDAVERALEPAGLPAHVVAGGPERADSVAAGLDAVPEHVGIVAVHDAARPLLPAPVAEAVREAVEVAGWPAAAPALPVSDALKRADEDRTVVGSVDRRGLWRVQTPQAARREVLRAALRARRAGRAADDDLTLLEAAGVAAVLVDGDPRNLKVTGPADLALAEALLRGGGQASDAPGGDGASR